MSFLRTRPTESLRDEHWRLRVEQEDDELTEITEELVTSYGPHAQRVESTRNDRLWLGAEEVRWLHASLGELIAEWDRAKP